MWLNSLTLALVEKNTDRLSELMENIPALTTKEEIDSALCLLKEATILVTSLQNETQSSMIQMQKSIKFLKVTEEKRPASLDIKS